MCLGACPNQVKDKLIDQYLLVKSSKILKILVLKSSKIFPLSSTSLLESTATTKNMIFKTTLLYDWIRMYFDFHHRILISNNIEWSN